MTIALALGAAGCAASSKVEARASSAPVLLPPIITTLPASKMCSHGARAIDCVKCHPELAAEFERTGDWCAEHQLPESQDTACHPELKFYDLPAVPTGADLLHVSREGEDVESLEALATPGKFTVIDFYASWCVPCRDVDAYMYELLAKRQDIAYRKINIVSWETPVAKRYLARVPTLPYLVIYGKDGKRLQEVTGLDLQTFERVLGSPN